MKFLLLGLLFMGFQALGQESCRTIDYRSELGPPRDQGDLSWCFAYTSADLISQRVKQKISATDLASTFILQDPSHLNDLGDPALKKYLAEHPNIYERIRKNRAEAPGKYDPDHILKEEGLTDTGGQEDTTILLANTKGMCVEQNFPSTEANQNRFLHQIAKIYAQKNKVSETQDNCPLFRPQTDMTSAIVDPVSVAMTDVYEKELDQRCQRKPWPVPLVPVMTKFGDDLKEYESRLKKGEFSRDQASGKLFDTLDFALEHGRVAAIGYSAYTIMKREEGEDTHGDHSSIIAGRKMINGKCQYLIRNTWGQDCDLYYKKFQGRCEQGNIWITKEELKESLYSVTYMK
jgi:hypothetical protein